MLKKVEEEILVVVVVVSVAVLMMVVVVCDGKEKLLTKTNHRAPKKATLSTVRLSACLCCFDLIRIIGISPPTLFAGRRRRSGGGDVLVAD